ncbi:hypothetical protein AB834_02325 [PVC group bacterium (ex Bugula neritina AB1)]|nr:hypothetical protein AB834_02325 [PVC group bacterium (ex Bugula neritina AB1)]
MHKFSFNSQALSYKGFKNCVRYAAVKFNSSFSNLPSKFSARNFKNTALEDFIHLLEAFDLNTLDNRPHSSHLMKEFRVFRDTIISGNSPMLKLKFIDPRFTILAIISFDDELKAYCNLVKKSTSSKNISITDPFFSHLRPDNKEFYFTAVSFVVFSTVGGINSFKQVDIIIEAYSEAAWYDENSDIFKANIITNFVASIHQKFFENPGAKIYDSNQALIRLLKYSEVKAFNDIDIQAVSKKVKCFTLDPLICNVDIVRKEISYGHPGFFEVSNNRFVIRGSSDFNPLKVYCEFLTVKFYEYIFNRVETEGEFIFFLEDDIKSCLVDANNAHTLSSYFDLSLNNVHRLNLSAMAHFDLTGYSYPRQEVESPAVKSLRASLVDKNLLMQRSIIDFSVLLALYNSWC